MTHICDHITIAELRELLAAGDGTLTLAEALAARETTRVSTEAHEARWAAFQLYLETRRHRRDTLAREAGEKARAAERKRHGSRDIQPVWDAAREAGARFDSDEPELNWAQWQANGEPDIHRASAAARAANAAKRTAEKALRPPVEDFVA